MREPAGLETPVMQRRGRAGACSRRLLLAILPAAALVLLLQTVGQAAAISAAGSASPHRLKVEIEARTVAVTRAERTALGVKPSIVSTQLRCGARAVLSTTRTRFRRPEGKDCVRVSAPSLPRSTPVLTGTDAPVHEAVTVVRPGTRPSSPTFAAGTVTAPVPVPTGSCGAPVTRAHSALSLAVALAGFRLPISSL